MILLGGPGVQDSRTWFNMSRSTEGFVVDRHPTLVPVSAFTEDIFVAGCCQGPKQIPDTVAQAGAAEAPALRGPGVPRNRPHTADIDEEACSECKTSVGLCPHGAVSVVDHGKPARITELLGKGCGTCAAACLWGTVHQNQFEDEQISNEITGIPDTVWTGRLETARRLRGGL
jgi:heterodisulfide reductase subunit A